MYKPRGNRYVILQTTFHHKNKTDIKRKELSVLLNYNATKRFIDTVDKMVTTYTTNRETGQLPDVVSSNMPDILALNSCILFCKIQSEKYIKFLSHILLFALFLCMSLKKISKDCLLEESSHREDLLSLLLDISVKSINKSSSHRFPVRHLTCFDDRVLAYGILKARTVYKGRLDFLFLARSVERNRNHRVHCSTRLAFVTQGT